MMYIGAAVAPRFDGGPRLQETGYHHGAWERRPTSLGMRVNPRHFHVQCRTVSDVEDFYAVVRHAGDYSGLYLDFELILSCRNLPAGRSYFQVTVDIYGHLIPVEAAELMGGGGWTRTNELRIMRPVTPVAGKEDKRLSSADSGKVQQ